MDGQKCVREGKLVQMLAPKLNHFRKEVDDDEEEMEGEPADGEHQHNHHQHLHHLDRGNEEKSKRH